MYIHWMTSCELQRETLGGVNFDKNLNKMHLVNFGKYVHSLVNITMLMLFPGDV